jgi:hypothetical protein
MKSLLTYFPGFKTSYLIIGGLNIVLAGSLFAKGLMPSMAEFKVPEETLASPHYYDAIFWVYTHMVVLGLIICTVGLLAKEKSLKVGLTLGLGLVHIFYTYLDFRSSDSTWGNKLYQGEASLIPAYIGLMFTCWFFGLFLKLLFQRE